MPGIARAIIDYATSHTLGDTHDAPHETLYIANPAHKVFVNGMPIVAQFDSVACGEIAFQGSTSVFVGGKGVHRLNDLCDSHVFTWSTSVCGKASSDVFAG